MTEAQIIANYAESIGLLERAEALLLEVTDADDSFYAERAIAKVRKAIVRCRDGLASHSDD